MRVSFVLTAGVVCAFAAGALGVPLLVQEPFVVRSPVGWVTDDWDDDASHLYKYTNLKDTGTDLGLFDPPATSTRAPIFRFDRSGSPGVSMSQAATFAIDTADGTTFDASTWFAWKGDYGNTATAQVTQMGISLIEGGYTQFVGMGHPGAAGISVGTVLSGVSGSDQWVQDSAPTLTVSPTATQITMVITVYHPNPGVNQTIDIKWDDVEIVQTPEPTAMALLGLGGLALVRLGRRRYR